MIIYSDFSGVFCMDLLADLSIDLLTDFSTMEISSCSSSSSKSKSILTSSFFFTEFFYVIFIDFAVEFLGIRLYEVAL